MAADGSIEGFEYRDICPLNDPGGPPLEEMAPEAFWTLGPIEQRLAAAQEQVDRGEGRRVALRALFQKGDWDRSEV